MVSRPRSQQCLAELLLLEYRWMPKGAVLRRQGLYVSQEVYDTALLRGCPPFRSEYLTGHLAVLGCSSLACQQAAVFLAA